MSEATQLTNKIINFIYREGGYAWRANSTGVFDKSKGLFRTAPKKGVSDVLACFKGKLFAVEVKIGKDRLSPEQDGFLANVKHAGGSIIIAKNFEEFKKEWRNELLMNF